MDVAFEKADGLLARRVIAERDVDVGVDEPGDGGRPVGIDDDVAGRTSLAEAVPTVSIFASWVMIVSPAASGARQSPETIVPILVMAKRMFATP